MRSRAGKRSSVRRRDGYVLLAVIATIVLVATVLTTLSKVSLRRALAAADATRRLQQRWGTESLQRAVLTSAPKVFERTDEQLLAANPVAPLPSTLRDAVTLGGVTFDLVLSDEDTKLNLNSVYRTRGLEYTQQVLQRMVPPPSTSAIRLIPAVDQSALNTERAGRPRQEDGGEDEPEIPDAFRSWGEVFDLSLLSVAFQSDAALPNLTTQISCWGSGQTNLRRASDETLLAIVSCVTSETEANRLLDRYRENPAMSVQILAQTQLADEQKRRQLARMLSGNSSNYSIWIDASTTGRRSLRRFTVMQQDREGVTQYRQFGH